jgi:Cu-Zn family superoxide dismutase
MEFGERRHWRSAMFRTLVASAAIAALAAAAATPALAATVHTQLQLATPTGPGDTVGEATITDSKSGAVIKIKLHGVKPGQHGLHLHQNPTCAPNTGPDGKIVPAGAAGPHYDPGKTQHHMGPDGQGHLGDLPRIEVGANGTAEASLTAPRIKDVSALKGLTLMLHVGGDNYSDTPPLGGGDGRMACGVLE